MIFPSDAEIREYCAYYIRAIKIFRETFKIETGREPTESELQDFSRMGIIPFGILKQQNGNSSFQAPQVQAQKIVKEAEKLVQQSQKMTQQSELKSKVESVKDILKDHPELWVEGDKIIIKKKIEPLDTFHEVKEKLEKKGWKYVEAKHTGVKQWEPAYFELKEGAKA